MSLLKIIMLFGKRKEKEFLDKTIQKKLKILNIVKKKLESNGMKMVH